MSLPSPYACMLATCVVKKKKKKTQAAYAVLHLRNMEN